MPAPKLKPEPDELSFCDLVNVMTAIQFWKHHIDVDVEPTKYSELHSLYERFLNAKSIELHPYPKRNQS